MSTTTTQTTEVMIIAPNRDAEEVPVAVGTTVGELAAKLNLPNAGSIRALDELSHEHGPGARIGIDFEPTALSYIFRLAGA